MWKLTRGRHVALRLNTLTHRRIPRTVWDGLRTPCRLRTLDLELRHPVVRVAGQPWWATAARFPMSLAAQLGSLWKFDNLQIIRLRVINHWIDCWASSFLAMLRQSSSLYNLSIDLSLSVHSMRREDSIIRDLAKLGECPSLRVLNLQLNRNPINDQAALYLAQGICASSSIQVLTLGLSQDRSIFTRFTRFTSAGVEALAGVTRVPSLRELCLNLSYQVGIDAQGVNSIVVASSSLQSLTLDLKGCQIGVAVARVLKNMTTLAVLHLNLGFNLMGNKGVECLSELRTSPSLHTLTLDLSLNDFGDPGAQELARLGQSSSLCNLKLVLCGNRVGNIGAKAMATLALGTALRTLTLNLNDNRVGGEGANALADLRPGDSSLRAVTLGLEHNRIGKGCAQHLLQWLDNQAATRPHFDCLCSMHYAPCIMHYEL